VRFEHEDQIRRSLQLLRMAAFRGSTEEARVVQVETDEPEIIADAVVGSRSGIGEAPAAHRTVDERRP
jgi:hypothetical protein